MSAAVRRIVPLALAALVVCTGLAPAQLRDPLPEVRARLKIEAQRVEKEVHNGRMRAYRLIRSDPEGAYDVIKGLIGVLRKDTSLSEARSKLLSTTLQRDLVYLRTLAGARPRTDPVAAATRLEVRSTHDPRVTAGGKSAYEEANRRIRSISGRTIETRKLREKTGDHFRGAMTKVDEASTLPASDYELPADWKEKSKRRSPAAKLTAKERALLAALKKPIKVDYDNTTFQSVIDDLSKRIGQTILLDKQAMEDAGVTYDSPITLRFNRPVSARTVLKRVLADVGLTYIVRNETIDVTSIARAKEMLTTRTYYIGDLMVGNPFLGPVANRLQMMQTISSLISQIQGIDPESWEGHGGPGSVRFDPARMALIVRQSAEMHYVLGGIGR